MNRLILIGNGFDLAHGMKTSYYDFICYYIRKSCKDAQTNITYTDNLMYVEKGPQTTKSEVTDQIDVKDLFYLGKPLLPEQTFFSNKIYRKEGYLNHYEKPFIINFQNVFIEKIFTRCHNSKWIDIENEFYEELKRILSLNKIEKQKGIIELNSCMYYLIEELHDYMSSQTTTKHLNDYTKLFTQNIIKDDIVMYDLGSDESPKNFSVLNFNYTSTPNKYLAYYDTVNFIHGNLTDKRNPIIFGFGDELDNDYKKLENEKEKGMLDYVKSFWYSKTSNYHNLIRFISSDVYQVYVLGHSCGLSDRTMLNMIFEHDNCKSIKIFYHETKNGNNHFELTQEISRHFHNKTKMRERIVPFDKSSRMPQWND